MYPAMMAIFLSACGSIFPGSRQAFRGFSLFDNADIIGFNKVNGLDITEPDALRVAAAKIAFENAPVGGIETHCTEWAHADA